MITAADVEKHRRRRIYERQRAAGVLGPRRAPKPFDPATIRADAERIAATLTPDHPDEIQYRQYLLADISHEIWETA